MPGIFPDLINGGLVIRDEDGTCTPQLNVENAFCPPATFITSCKITALPSDCTARLSARQLNAIVSEILCLAATLTPEGEWDCEDTCNLSAAFSAWVLANNVTDGITIGGNGTVSDPFRVIYAGLISGDAINSLGIGADGKLTVKPADIVSDICATDAAGDALAACLISVSSENLVHAGVDGRIYLSAVDIATGIGLSDAAGDALAGQMISLDAGNWLQVGTDGRIRASERYNAQTTVPLSPRVGDHWTNTSGATVAGVPAGGTGRWTGAAWAVTSTNSVIARSSVDLTVRSTSSSAYINAGPSIVFSPRSTTSSIIGLVTIYPGCSTTMIGDFTIYRNGVAITPAGKQSHATIRTPISDVDATIAPYTFEFEDTPGTIAPVTYDIRWRTNTGALYLGRRGADTSIAVPSASMVVLET